MDITKNEIVRVACGFLLAAAIVRRSYRKQSLTSSGLVAAFFVGFLAFAASYRFGITVFVFYASSTRLTRFKAEIKKKLEDGYKEGGQRSAEQVLCASLTATVISLLYVYLYRWDGPILLEDKTWASVLLLGYLGFYAAATGDTWASEVGLVAGYREKVEGQGGPSSLPVLVVPPFRRVPRGTNGAVSGAGTLASLGGGLVVGLFFWLLGLPYSASAPRQWVLLVAGALAGGFGSLIDSLLGALLQGNWLNPTTGKIVSVPPASKEEANKLKLEHICGINLLSNEVVNLLSCTVMAAASAMMIFLF